MRNSVTTRSSRPAVPILLRSCLHFGLIALSLIGLVKVTALGAQESPAVYQGTWTASVGSGQFLRGAWAGQVSSRNPNTASGSWTLLNDAGEVVLQGTWSAQKNGRGWAGTWAARIANGRSFTGTWAADLDAFQGKTFADMLKRTTEKQVAGSWRSGRYQGYWWLNGSPAPRKRP